MPLLGQRIYLDHAATTSLAPEARAAFDDGLARWANPSSPHAEGRAARAALEDARARIAVALGWAGALIFTSGASEALALALGRARAGRRLISAVEHDAVRRAARDAIIVPVARDGLIDLAALDALLAAAGPCPLVAVQSVNSETGVIQPLAEVAERVRRRGGLLLADCAQSAGKLALPDADFAVVSAHKLGGPAGVGALLVRDLASLEAAGGQEQGYRSGTENMPAALAFAAAVELSPDWVDGAAERRALLDARILANGGEVVGGGARLATIASYRMPGVPAAAQLIRFDLAGFAVSAGSACSSGSLRPSHVLSAMGWDERAAGEVVRVSFGCTTTAAEIEAFAALWTAIAAGAKARAA